MKSKTLFYIYYFNLKCIEEKDNKSFWVDKDDTLIENYLTSLYSNCSNLIYLLIKKSYQDCFEIATYLRNFDLIKFFTHKERIIYNSDISTYSGYFSGFVGNNSINDNNILIFLIDYYYKTNQLTISNFNYLYTLCSINHDSYSALTIIHSNFKYIFDLNSFREKNRILNNVLIDAIDFSELDNVKFIITLNENIKFDIKQLSNVFNNCEKEFKYNLIKVFKKYNYKLYKKIKLTPK